MVLASLIALLSPLHLGYILLSMVLLMVVFGVLYLVFAILFGGHLGRWDDNVPGRCYNTRYLALPDAHHPLVDKIYLGVTCFYMFGALNFALILAISRCEVDQAWGMLRPVIEYCKVFASITDRFSRFPGIGSWADQQGLQSIIWYPFELQIALARANLVLTTAMLQLPLHLYFIIRLRLSNEPLLSNGSDENQWGFGQIYALIMSAGLVVECCKGYLSAYICSILCEYHDTKARGTGYWNAKRRFKHRDENAAISDDKTGIPPGSPAPEVQHPVTAAIEGKNIEISD